MPGPTATGNLGAGGVLADSARGKTVGRAWTDVMQPAATRPRGRVVVLPHAGAGPRALLSLARPLPRDLEVVGVTLPGREGRLGESFAASAADPAAVVATVADELRRRAPLPTTLFGHSLGAALAGAVAQVAPELFVRVVLSSYPTVGTPAERAGRWPDHQLVAMLRRGGGTPDEVLGNPHWRRHVLDLLRADLTLAVRLAHDGFGAPLAMPLTVLDGERDDLVDPADPLVWRSRAGAGLRRLVLPGGHFYLLDTANGPAVVSELVGDLVPGDPAAGDAGLSVAGVEQTRPLVQSVANWAARRPGPAGPR